MLCSEEPTIQSTMLTVDRGVQHSADMGEIDDLERFIAGALGETSA